MAIYVLTCRKIQTNKQTNKQKKPILLQAYGKIIEDQDRRNFIEKVPYVVALPNKLHYISHPGLGIKTASYPTKC
jgi:hypothetical protein